MFACLWQGKLFDPYFIIPRRGVQKGTSGIVRLPCKKGYCKSGWHITTVVVMIKKMIVVMMFLVLAFGNNSCSQSRTFLTQEEKAWNPYREGQILVFGTVGGYIDTLKISSVEDDQFPEGLGALQNERLRVLATLKNRSIAKGPIEVSILYIFSKTSQYSSKIDFQIFLKDGGFLGKAIPIDELKSYAEITVQTQYGVFDDVIRIDYRDGQVLKDTDIATIYWSRSTGYIKCIKKDGTIWELISITNGF